MPLHDEFPMHVYASRRSIYINHDPIVWCCSFLIPVFIFLAGQVVHALAVCIKSQ